MTDEQETQEFTVEQRDEYARTKPGVLDPRRIGLLSWTELKVKPQQDQVIVQLDPPKMTQGGLHLPESSRRREPVVEATVVACGPGAYDNRGRLIPMEVKPGDRVLVSGDAGWEVGPHRMLRQGAIMVVLEGMPEQEADRVAVAYFDATAPKPPARKPYWGPELAENLGLTPEEAQELLE